jgi:hypothetical protein
VSLSNLSAITSQAALIAALRAGISTGAGSSGNVTVVITSMKLSSSYNGFIAGFSIQNVIAAYANMTGLNITLVTVNGQSSGGRRLATTADVVASIPNADGSDVVADTKAAAAATTVSGFTTALAAQGVNVSSLFQFTATPTATAEVTSTVIGSSSATLDEATLQNSVGSAVPGGATASGIVIASSSTTATTAAPTTSVGVANDDSGAISIVAPTMTIWAAAYAFMMA